MSDSFPRAESQTPLSTANNERKRAAEETIKVTKTTPPTKKARTNHISNKVYGVVYTNVCDGVVTNVLGLFYTWQKAHQYVEQMKLEAIVEWLENDYTAENDIYGKYFCDSDEDDDDVETIVDEKKVRHDLDQLWAEYADSDPTMLKNWEILSACVQ